MNKKKVNFDDLPNNEKAEIIKDALTIWLEENSVESEPDEFIKNRDNSDFYFWLSEVYLEGDDGIEIFGQRFSVNQLMENLPFYQSGDELYSAYLESRLSSENIVLFDGDYYLTEDIENFISDWENEELWKEYGIKSCDIYESLTISDLSDLFVIETG